MRFFEPMVSYRFILSVVFTAMFVYGMVEAWMSFRSIYLYLEQNFGRYRLHRVFLKYIRWLLVGAPLWKFRWIWLQILLLSSAWAVLTIEAWRVSHS